MINKNSLKTKLFMQNIIGEAVLTNIGRETNYSMILCSFQN